MDTIIDHTTTHALEHALRETPLCAACGRPTTVVARGTSLWIECPALAEGRTLTRVLRSLDLGSPHTRREIVDAAA